MGRYEKRAPLKTPAQKYPVNRPLVERGGEREKCFPFPFLAIFSPHRELVHRLSWEANPSRVMKKKFLKKKFLVGRGYPEGKWFKLAR